MAVSNEQYREARLTMRQGQWVATRVWLVTGADTESEALGATPLPGTPSVQSQGDPHPRNSKLRVISNEFQQTGPTNWLVTANYEMASAGTPDTPGSDDPLDAPLQVIAESVVFQEPIYFGAQGTPLGTLAGQPYDPAPVKDVYATRISITRNEPYFDLEKQNNYRGRVNDTSFVLGTLTVDVRDCLVEDITMSEPWTPDSDFARVRYQFLIRNDKTNPHDHHSVHSGTMGRYDASLPPGPFVREDGHLAGTVLLSSTGVPLDSSIKVLKPNGDVVNAVALGSLPAGVTTTTQTIGSLTVTFLIQETRLTCDIADLGITFT